MKIVAAFVLFGFSILPVSAGQVAVVNPSGIVSVTVAPTAPAAPVASIPSAGNSTSIDINNSAIVEARGGLLTIIASSFSDLDIGSFTGEQIEVLVERIERILSKNNLSDDRISILRHELDRLTMLARR